MISKYLVDNTQHRSSGAQTYSMNNTSNNSDRHWVTSSNSIDNMIVVMCLLHISSLSLCAAVMLFNGVDLVIKEAVEVTRRGQTFWNVPWPFYLGSWLYRRTRYLRKKETRSFDFFSPQYKTIDTSIFAPPTFNSRWIRRWRITQFKWCQLTINPVPILWNKRKYFPFFFFFGILPKFLYSFPRLQSGQQTFDICWCYCTTTTVYMYNVDIYSTTSYKQLVPYSMYSTERTNKLGCCCCRKINENTHVSVASSHI